MPINEGGWCAFTKQVQYGDGNVTFSVVYVFLVKMVSNMAILGYFSTPIDSN